jgi:transposase
MKLSERQWKRVDVARRVGQRQLTVREASIILGISRRQVQRICGAVAEGGVGAVVHGNTGRAPPNKLDEATRRQVVKLRQAKYEGFNDQHFTEKLAEVEGIALCRSTVRRLLRSEGIGSPRRRRAPKHRRRRERKAQSGLMLQWDGSQHDWLEGRGPPLCLMGAVDDATAELLEGAHFVMHESAAGYLQVLRSLVPVHGIPQSIYMDQHGTLKRNDAYWTLEEELRGQQDPTHVGRALQLLAIEPLYALTPQGKGRVERLWGTLQDRLISELRLQGACSIEQANGVLERFRPDYNRRFAVQAANEQPAWRPLRKQLDLDRVCSLYYEATVLNDNTVRLAGLVIDIPAGPRRRSYAKARVEVRQLLDGSWRVYYHDRCIATHLSTGTKELRAIKKRKRSAASRAFRKSIQQVASSLP